MAFSLALLGASTYEVPVAAGSYDLLATEILTSSQSSITFASLGDYAADYQHLQIRYSVRGAKSAAADDLRVRLNGSSSTYPVHYLYGDGSSVYSTSDPFNSMYLLTVPAASETANIFGSGVVDFLDAFETTKFKTMRALSGRAASTSSILLLSGLYQSTTAIDSINIYGQSGDLADKTRISLYGIRKAA
jgi:hypothetical protein